MTSGFDPRITAYFGDAVLSAGFVAVPHLLLRHYHRLGMTASQAMFVLQLMESTWDLAEPPRTSGELARRMGVDKRTIRRYSEELAALGLLALYDQFDEHGAQIGNGYDLSPLFGRLAELAPEPRPDRASSRRPRQAPAVAEERAQQPTPGQQCPPHPRTTVSAPPPDSSVRPGEDPAIHPPRIGRSALNRTARTNNKQQEQMLPAAANLGQPAARAQPQAGFSLRLGRPLDGTEVARSDELLRAMGIEQPVRGVIAPSLAPAETWALRLYAAAKNWSVGLTIAQVYDRPTRSAKAAEDVSPQLVKLGSALATLPSERAEIVLAGILDALDGPAPPVGVVGSRVHTALMSTWPLLQRAAARGPSQPSPRSSGTLERAAAAAPSELWQRVVQRLAAQLPPADVATWIAGSRLLKLDEGEATIGAGNIFARDHLEAHYRPVLEAALGAELGTTLNVQVVID